MEKTRHVFSKKKKTCSLQRRRKAWKIVQERMQNMVCIDDILMMEDRVFGSWIVGMVFSSDVLVVQGCQIRSSMACSGCCSGLVRSMVMVFPLVS